MDKARKDPWDLADGGTYNTMRAPAWPEARKENAFVINMIKGWGRTRILKNPD